MATWLLAAKAIKDSDVKLKGDLVFMAVVGEIGLEPVDEFQPPAYVAKEAGTRYAITHGGVTDYALVSEGTDFGIVGVEAGKAFFKITVFGNDLTIYTPYIQRPTTIEESPSAIVRISKLIERIDAGPTNTNRKIDMSVPVAPWCRKSTSAQSAAGCLKLLRPCNNVQSISMYGSRQSKSRLKYANNLGNSCTTLGFAGEVELYVYRPGFEVDETRGRLWGAITRAHRAVVGGEPKPAPVSTSSMWRDLNCFNEMRIPSYTYGPGVSVGGGIFRMPIKNPSRAQLYVHTALDLCNQDRT